MNDATQAPTKLSVIDRTLGRAREFYWRVDWQSVTVVIVIALGAVGMFFMVVGIGDSRADR